MRTGRIAGGVLVVAGAATALEASTFDVAFMTDPVGPKALPYLVATMLAVAGLSALLQPEGEPALPGRPAVARMAGALLAFLAYAALLPLLGFFTSTTLVVTVLSLLYGGPLPASVGSAALLSGGLWLLFVQALSLPLPVGDLWIR
ncbi:MAG: tripartite tricarboxylate transporter TctB family protein [Longimicrobiales bacterium]|nr:tripartite tricarboxylate transporter TctB family protein [Longimicrobiales bacterium]